MEDSLLEKNEPPPQQPNNLWNIGVLCISIFTVYAGYNTTMVFAAKLMGNLGIASVATFYVVAIFAGGTLPQYLANRFGARFSLFLSGMIYALYVLTLVYCIVPLMFATACMCGLSAAVLWTVVPTEINKNTNDASRGFFNALLWASLKFSGVPGNLVALAVLEKNGGAKKEDGGFKWVRGWTEDSWLFLAFACLCAGGSCMFLALSNKSSSANSSSTTNANIVRITRKGEDKDPVCVAENGQLVDAVGFDSEVGGGGGDDDDDDDDDSNDDNDTGRSSSTRSRSHGGGGVLQLVKQCPHLKCLIPLMFFSGFNIGIIYGSLSGLMPVLVVPKAYVVIATVEVVTGHSSNNSSAHLSSAQSVQLSSTQPLFLCYTYTPSYTFYFSIPIPTCIVCRFHRMR
jgi:hypothetical protein